MRCVKTFPQSNVVLCLKDNALRSQNRNAGMYLVVSARLLMDKNARQFMLKNVTQLPDKSVKRFTTRRFVVTSGPKSANRCPRKNANKCPRRNALMFRRGSARLWRRKSARLFLGHSVPKSLTGSVAASLSKSAQMSLSSSASRRLRLNVRISIGGHAPKFQSKIVNRRQDVSAHWFPPSRPRKFLTVSVQLHKGMSVNQSPSKSAMMSMNHAKCATMYQRKFVTTLVQENVLLPPDKSVPMLLSRFQDRPTRLNVRLNTLKSVASLAVVMETKLFELFLH